MEMGVALHAAAGGDCGPYTWTSTLLSLPLCTVSDRTILPLHRPPASVRVRVMEPAGPEGSTMRTRRCCTDRTLARVAPLPMLVHVSPRPYSGVPPCCWMVSWRLESWKPAPV